MPITAPPDAISVDEWHDRDGEPIRGFSAARWTLPIDDGEVRVMIDGEQTLDGITRKVYIESADPLALGADQLVQLAEILQTAHAALDVR